MSSRRVIRAVERVVRDVGGAIQWHLDGRHRGFTITLPNGKIMRGGLSYGMNFDEMRVVKMMRGKLRKEMNA